ncbi:MAG: PEP-CTERM sorting domain-containing protein [Rhodocyclaceae bacterium]|nr:PEP-CTERM sorting domain-containing protein [Rhodocyclaceae bacterium]
MQTRNVHSGDAGLRLALKFAVAFIATASLLLPVASHAATVTWRFEGPSIYYDTYCYCIRSGGVQSGTLTFDDSVADSNPDPTVGQYSIPYGMGFSVTGLGNALDGGRIEIIDRPPGERDDFLALTDSGSYSIQLELNDARGTAYSDDILRPRPPRYHHLTGGWVVDSNPYGLEIFVTKLTCDSGCPPIPEPESYLLLFSGLMMLANFRRRKSTGQGHTVHR